MTRSPTVIEPENVKLDQPRSRSLAPSLPSSNAPSVMPLAARYIIPVKAVEKMTFCPMLSAASEVEILTEAFV